MDFISKYNMTFVTYINRKYNRKFRNFDEYILYIFDINDNKASKYYSQLEDDLKDYCSYQQERRVKNGKTRS